MASAPFKLSSVLLGHSNDVRAVAVTHNNGIVSASRDKTAKYWLPNEINCAYSEVVTFKGHSHFVSSLCVLPPSQRYPLGVIVTGGNDNIICLFSIDNPLPINKLEGHSDTVCNLSAGLHSDILLSSSWDKTAKLWNISTNCCETTFEGHQAAVWAVIQLNNGNVVTGGADKNIILWDKSGTQIRTLTGHTDCVRGLAVLNSEIFLSVANDASIKQWTVLGDCVNTFYGHTNYIYSVCVDKNANNGSFITSGEDSTVRYWQGGENTQTISLPAQSVWSVACLSNGDVVTGTSDGIVRVFTQDPGRFADEAALKVFESEVNAAAAASTQEIGGVKISDLPGREVLYEPGRTDGQTKIIRDGTVVQCYSWSAAEGKWNKVGDVLGSTGGSQETSGKVLYEGKEYDFVFSVDIEDGIPPLKLPYNLSEDPWHAAQKFIHKNNLSQMFLDQVANFIIKNSGGGQHTIASNTAGYEDPFTGGSRYVPGSNANTAASSGGNADPFTGGSSYTTNNASNSRPKPQQEWMDTSSASPTNDIPPFTPQKSYLRFDVANFPAIYKKIKELNTKTGDGIQKVDEHLLEDVIKLADEGRLNPDSIDVLFKLLEWPHDIVFPVLDVLRLAIRHQSINTLLCSKEYSPMLIKLLQTFINTDCKIKTNQMLALRVLSNMFNHASGEELALQNRQQFLSTVSSLETDCSKTQVALATVILNYCVAFQKRNDANGLETITNAVISLIPKLTDNEAYFRLLVAAGTVIHITDPSIKPLINRFNSDQQFKHKVNNICYLDSKGASDLLKLVTCAKQIKTALSESI